MLQHGKFKHKRLPMKKIKLLISFVLLQTLAISCTEDGLSDDLSFIDSSEPTELSNIFDISTDNSGNVKITPTGEGVTEFMLELGHGDLGLISLSPGNSLTHSYPEGNYTVTIISKGITGIEVETTYPLELTYRAPENIVINKTIEGSNLTVSATADYANGFLVYFGDVTNEVGTPMAVDQTLPPHTYSSPGVYNLKVVALSGGVAQSELIEQITIYAPYSLPITYESPIQNYNIGGTFGDVIVAQVANPFPGGINTSATVRRYTKPVGAPSWGGTWTPLSTPNGTPININNGSKIKVMVYATEVGKMLNVEIEQGSNGVANQILKVATTVANQWEELVFDFGSLGIPAGTTFNQLVFRYNDAANGTGEVIYIDNVQQTN